MKSLVLTLKREEYLKKRNIFFKYFLYLFFYIIAFLFFISPSFGQCEMKFGYEVVEMKGKNYSIKINVSKGLSPYKVVLYDLKANKNLKLLESSNSSFSIEGIAPGNYALRVRDSKNCKSVQEIELVDASK